MADDIHQDPAFPETRWTRIRRASDPEQRTLALQAMEALCSEYWYPIYAYARRRSLGKEAAEDLTQDFFSRLTAEDLLARADPNRGRLRTFLLTIAQRQIASGFERDNAQKRGGGTSRVSLDLQNAEGRYKHEPVDAGLTPEQLFDRQWALATLDRAFERLSKTLEQQGRVNEFVVLRPFLRLQDAGESSTSQAAAELGVTEENVRQKIRRIRVSLREALLAEVAECLANPTSEAVEEEFANLRAALG